MLLLIMSCQSWSAPWFEYTPLGYAVEMDDREIVMLLLSSGASTVAVSKVNGKALSPAQIATEFDKSSWFEAMRTWKSKEFALQQMM